MKDSLSPAVSRLKPLLRSIRTHDFVHEYDFIFRLGLSREKMVPKPLTLNQTQIINKHYNLHVVIQSLSFIKGIHIFLTYLNLYVLMIV